MAKTEELHADKDYGFIGQLGGDVAQGVGGELAKLPLKIAPGLNELVIFLSSFGNAMQSAKNEGKRDAEALPYAFATAAVELATEKILGFADLAGKGGVDDVIERGIKKISSNPAVQKSLKIIAGGAGEGFEEFIAGIAESYINKVTIKADECIFSETLKDSLYDALVSGITGVVVGTANSIGARGGKLPSAEDIEDLTTQAAEETVNSIARGDSVALRKMVSESQHERNMRLKNASIKITAAKKGGGEHFDKSMLSGVRKQDAGKYLAPILRKLGIFTKYQNPALDVSFEYSGNALRRSAAHQERESGNRYNDFALVNANLKELCENAYPAEAHIDEKPPTSDGHVQAAATLFSVLRDGERLIPVKMTVKFYDNQDPTLHIVIASDKTQNKSIPEDAAGTQNAHHVAGDTLTNMSVSDFLGLVNGSEQFTKRMPDISRKTAKGQIPLLYTERLLEHAKRDGYIYSQRLLRRELEKAQRKLRKAKSKGNGSRPTIYADRLSQYSELVDFEDNIDSDDLNADFENDADSDTIFAGAVTDCFDRKVGITSAEE
ncbi:MAG: hypothetical protein J6R40_06130, partial [Clostridia bacterium]|nr:hypothetical protein [Clostridia bacterium]